MKLGRFVLDTKLRFRVLAIGIIAAALFVVKSVYQNKAGLSEFYGKILSVQDQASRNRSSIISSRTALIPSATTRNIMEWPNINETTKRNINKQPNLTIVTAYFDIGKFGKGSPQNVWSVKTYLEFARSFKYLLNPVVIYTDSQNFFNLMQTLRANLTNITKMFLIDKNSSWAFQRKEKIENIYAIKGYPEHYPNTVVPEYSCAQHAKYDVVARAATRNYFQTDYFAWLDVGLFRAEGDKRKYFMLQTPPDFNSSRIAVNLVHDVRMNTEISQIFRRNLVWVCGCIFVGKREIILKYTEQYKRAVDYFLSQELMNTDQQVLYAMYSVSGKKEIKPEIDVQLYKQDKPTYNMWFALGYVMRQFI